MLSMLHGQTAQEILEEARMNPTSHQAALRARIRGEGSVTPMKIRLGEGLIRYEFSEPEQTILLSLGADQTQISERTGGVTRPLPSARLHDPVRGTGVTYEDLSLGFLYWPHPVLQGDQNIRSRQAWKMDLQAPSGEPLYGVARVWIDKESGAILRIEGYDKKGQLLRRFEVVSAQKIEGLWMLKQMRIESFTAGKSQPANRRYLEVLGKD